MNKETLLSKLENLKTEFVKAYGSNTKIGDIENKVIEILKLFDYREVFGIEGMLRHEFIWQLSNGFDGAFDEDHDIWNLTIESLFEYVMCLDNFEASDWLSERIYNEVMDNENYRKYL